MSKITPEQVERAAVAIHRVFANRSGRARTWNGPPGRSVPEHLKQQYREEASAALRAALEVPEQ